MLDFNDVPSLGTLVVNFMRRQSASAAPVSLLVRMADRSPSETFTVVVKPTDTVATVAAAARQRYPALANVLLRVRFPGRLLEDGKTIADCVPWPDAAAVEIVRPAYSAHADPCQDADGQDDHVPGSTWTRATPSRR